MSYDEDIRDEIFERLGTYVQWWYELDSMKDTLDDLLDEAIEDFNIKNVGGASDTPSEADKGAYEAFSAEIHRQQNTLESLRYAVVNLVSDFLGLNVKDLLDAPYTSSSDILDHLVDLMDDNDDAVEENTVDVVAVGSDLVAEDEDNSVLAEDGLTLPTLDDPPTQLARDDHFSLVCTDDSTVDQEHWTLSSGRLEQFSGQIVTDEEVDWEATGIEGLKVNKAPVHDWDDLVEEGDTYNQLSNWVLKGLSAENTDSGKLYGYLYLPDVPRVELCKDEAGTLLVASGDADNGNITLVEENGSGITGSVTQAYSHDDDVLISLKALDHRLTGAVKGTNISEDGQVWVKFNDQQSFEDENDELGQLSNWDLDELVFGEDTDIDGKVYVSVVKEPAGYQVLGGTMAVLDASEIIIDDADDTNTDDGTFYASVNQQINTDETRDFTVYLYSDSARQNLEASGSVSDVDDTDLPVEIELTAETGGVDGSVTLDAFNSVQDDQTDDTILIKVPRYFVRVYSSSGRAEDDLYAEGVSYVPKVTGTEKLDLYRPGEETSSFDVGDVNLNYVQDNETIILTVDFYTIDMYKADPDDSDTTDDDIVARAGSYTNLLAGNKVSGLAFHAVNNSGLTDVTVSISDAQVSDGYTMSVVVGYAVGDKFTFSTSTEDDGRFQTFLRDSYDKVFPSGTGSDITIPDSLAGGS